MSAGERAGVAPVPAGDACWAEPLGPARLLAGTPLVPVAIIAELAEMIAGYYAARGWTADGQVPTATLRALGLEELAGAEGPTAEDGVAPRCGVRYG